MTAGWSPAPPRAAPREREALRGALAGPEDARVRLTEVVLVDHPDLAGLDVTTPGCVRRPPDRLAGGAPRGRRAGRPAARAGGAGPRPGVWA